uniref:Succinate dehydrogenase complex assembly factor 2 n=1 Tax=Homo sapiens TaxID=9606 RepID=A0AAQ5BH83_HUMAN
MAVSTVFSTSSLGDRVRCPGWNAVVRSQLTAALTFPGSDDLPTSAS